MQYDPIKHKFSSFIQDSPFLKILFFKLLGIFFLREWYIKRKIKEIFNAQKPAAILDAGCGFGQYTYFMNKQSPTTKIEAVDLNPEHVRRVAAFAEKMIMPVTTSVQDLTKFQNPTTYDFILCVDVMEHIEDDRSVLKNYYASLKSGGHLLISTPSDQGGSESHHDHDHDNPEAHGFIDEHARDGYSIADMTEKLETEGFSVKQIKYTYGAAGKISWKLAIKYPILLLNASMIFAVILPFYFVITIIPILILHQLDTLFEWETGTGLMVHAIKK